MAYQPTAWGDVPVGATVLCPNDGTPERVTRNSVGTGTVRIVRTERHGHRPGTDAIVSVCVDTGRRDASYRTRWGTVIVTRPGHRMPWWVHLPAAWHRTAEHLPVGHRQNSYGGFLFRSQAAAERWLEPYLVDILPPVKGRVERRQPGTQPLRVGGYT